MSAPAIIRHATEADAGALARLRYEFRAELIAPQEERAAFIRRAADWMTHALRDGQWLCWIAEDDTGIIGSLWLYRIPKIPNPNGNPEEHAYVSSFCVCANARNRGIGSMLLADALAFCEVRRIDSVILWPTERSRPLYLRHGFRVSTGMLDKPIAGHHST
ncbi:MAG TPA: GNAT family N-acetyltransferase [Gemmatimonadaceae bacterium]|nr:GNAT family N-acetyltransferase [Gemmatimonadaceae bacterium]